MPDREHTSEKLSVDIEGTTYSGILRFVKVDKLKQAFEVSYRDQHHVDGSLFKYGREDQIRIHARSVLKTLVEQQTALDAKRAHRQ